MSEERIVGFVGGAAVILVVSTVAIGGRFWSRILTSQLGADDWTCLLAWIFNTVICISGIVWTHFGLGRHISTVYKDDLDIGLKILFYGYYIFDIGVGLVKTSALLFYQRVFGVHSTRMRVALWVGHILVAIWYVFTVVVISLTCSPVEKIWNPSVPGRCIDVFPPYLATGLWDTFVDLYILLLPTPIIWKLQARPTRKILIVLALMLGYCCLIASVGRLAAILTSGSALNKDITWNGLPVLVWTLLEIGFGIISICVPSWWHLSTRVRKQGFRSLFTTRNLQQNRSDNS